MLKSHTLTGPATFKATPVVWIDLQCTKDNIELLERLLRWLLKERIHHPISAGRVGGGAFSSAFSPEDADRVNRWLLDQGAVPGAAAP